MILAGDIGGTKCNLAAFAQHGSAVELVFQNRYATRDFSSFGLLLSSNASLRFWKLLSDPDVPSVSNRA